jgi:hypothetical protein
MALFKSDPQKTMQREIDNARVNHDRLSAKLLESETAVIARKAAARALALDATADDGALDKAEVATRAAQDRASTIAGAKIEVEQQLVALERNRDELVEKKQRAETAAEVEAMAIDLEKVALEIDPLLERMVSICARAHAGQIWNAAGLGNFATASKKQVPDAVSLVAASLREHTARVLNGLAPASLPKPESPPASVAATPAAAKGIFTYSDPPRGLQYVVPGGFSKETT